jgi:hypothetical protein
MKAVQWSNAKFRYEIEIPIELVQGNKKPAELVLTSQK